MKMPNYNKSKTIAASRAQKYKSNRAGYNHGDYDIEENIRYKASLFSSSMGGSHLLTRAVFYGYHRLLAFIVKAEDTRAFLRAGILLVGLVFASIIFLGFDPFGYWLVGQGQSYTRPSEIYATNAKGENVLIAEFYRSARRPIHLNSDDALSSKVVRAFIAAEDTRFFYHPGVDFLGIARAFVVNILAGKVKEGASTITQQVARLRFLSQERSILRKLREAFFAFFLELQYTKREILQDYLNMVPLGHGTSGIEAASRFYFFKSYDELTWGEAALLASLTTRPREFSPIRNPKQSLHKVKVTLQKLVENGDLTIVQAENEFAALKRDFYVVLNRSPNDSAFHKRVNLYPYVTAFVRSQLPTPFRSEDILSTGGLRIYTTIQDEHQRAARENMLPYLKKVTSMRYKASFSGYHTFDRDFYDLYRLNSFLLPLPEFALKISRAQRDLMLAFDNEFIDGLGLLSRLGGAGNGNLSAGLDHYLFNSASLRSQEIVEGALVSLRSYSGEITAVIGGSGFSPRNQQLRFNGIRRQPGSAFKPIIIGSALEYSLQAENKDKIITAATIFDDSPVHFVNRDLSEYSPENYSGSYEGYIRLRKALTLSKNSVSIQVYRSVGADNINSIAEPLLQLDRQKPRRFLPREATVALGSYGLSPLQMAASYAVFASQGREVFPHVIKRITDANGKILYDYEEQTKAKEVRQIISPSTAALMVSLLKDVVEVGTGQAARLNGRMVAGKTGTTNRSTNTWFVGFTPALVTCVYVGYDEPKSLGASSTGGNVAAPIWGKYMYQALKKTRPKSYDFNLSKLVSVEICEKTGVLPEDDCEKRIQELFLPGTEPQESSPTVQTNSSTGRRSESYGSEASHENSEEEEEVFVDTDLHF